MPQKKIIIADANEEFLDALYQALSADFLVKTCSDGAKAMELILQWEPDILVTELTLSHMDGIAIIKQLQELPRQPQILVISGMLSEFVQCILEQLGIQYALKKPCSALTAAERVMELSALSVSACPFPRVYSAMAGEALMELGLSNQRLGFQHLLVGLPLLMVQRDRRLSKELYAEISIANHTDPTRIEKNIRDAIREAWENRDPAIWSRYFPGTVRCPGNKAFLFRLTDVLMEQILRKAV